MATIKAPFNFVPLSDDVFIPDWWKEVSHDVPFEDGVSGKINFKITAMTPIFVRNGHTEKDAEAKNDIYSSFAQRPDNKYFIPATSIKGCIRNVFEILSFGKMTQVDNASFGKRDLDDQSYTSIMRKVKCGWLYIDDSGYMLEDHGTPKRVSIKEVDKVLGGDRLYKFISETEFTGNNENDKLARRKYEIIYKVKNKNADLSCKEGYDAFLNSEDYLLKNSDDGTFVLTGQSSRRYFDKDAKKPKVGKDGIDKGCWKGKGKEFLFPKEVKKIRPIPESVFKAFETIHKESVDYYSFWRIKLLKGQKIPVFFVIQNDEIHSIGLSGMYKYPYRQTIENAIPNNFTNPTKDEEDKFQMDLAECVFGHIYGSQALKGRVNFSHALAIGTQTPMENKTFVSGSPHPSFYPLYVKDGKNWDFATEIAGRKRYPIRVAPNYSNSGTKKMEQNCRMLNKGTRFECNISFHNLKPVELGALLSALTFHKNQDKCCHSIGFGKPYGYGSIKISNVKLNFVDNSKDYYMLEFEKEMEKQFPNWRESSSVKELINMAQGIPVGQEGKFQYLTMSNNREDNEFLQVKKIGERLTKFSAIVNRDCHIPSVSSSYVSYDEELKDRKKEEDDEKLRKQKAEEEKCKREKQFLSLDFSFLSNETKMKIAWSRIEKKLKELGKEFNNDTFSLFTDENKTVIVDFCKKMFARKDSKWGNKNGDYAKEFASQEVKRIIGVNYYELK